MKEALLTPLAPAPIGPYSQAVKCGKTIYISGQIGLNLETGELFCGTKAQLIRIFTSLEEIVKVSGGSLDDVVKLSVFVTDLADFGMVNEFIESHFKAPFPARSVVEVKALPKGASVEIEAILQLP